MERWLNKSKLIDPYKVFPSAEEAARHIDPEMDEPETVRLITKEESEEYKRLKANAQEFFKRKQEWIDRHHKKGQHNA